MAQIIIQDGYVVQEFFALPPDPYRKWHSLRNFGDRQSDAIEFRNDVNSMEELELRSLAKRYDSSIKYIRINKRNFKKQGYNDALKEMEESK